jgi:PAB1-binding protein PBP1
MPRVASAICAFVLIALVTGCGGPSADPSPTPADSGTGSLGTEAPTTPAATSAHDL